MILGPLIQSSESMAGGLAAAPTGAKAADFSIALSGATAGSPGDAGTSAALAEPAPGPTVSTVALLPAVDDADLNQGPHRLPPGSSAGDEEAGDPDRATSPPVVASLVGGQSAAAVATAAVDPDLPINPGAAIATAPTLPKAARGSGPSTTRSSKASDPDEPSVAQLDPSMLTVQQALAAAASLVAPAVAIDRASRPATPQQASAALFVGNNALAGARLPGSTEPVEALALVPAKPGHPIEPGAPAATPPAPLLSHSLVPMLGLHLFANVAHRVDVPQLAADLSRGPSLPAGPQASDMHQLDALLRDIAEVSGSSGRAALRLTAEQLGGLEIKLRHSDAGISISIQTDSEQGRSTVVQAQQQLHEDMRASGLKVAATSVMLGDGGAQRERHDRHPMPLAAPIEAAAPDPYKTEPADEQRPDGRYA